MLLFGGVHCFFRICVYGLMPWLQQAGMPQFWSFMISYGLPLMLLIVFTAIGLKQEGNLNHWRARLRLNALTFKKVMLCTAIFVASFLLTGLLVPTAQYLASTDLFSPPDFLPDILDPNKAIPGRQLVSFMGIPLKGAYWVVAVYFVFLTCFNILGRSSGFADTYFRGKSANGVARHGYTMACFGACSTCRSTRGRSCICCLQLWRLAMQPKSSTARGPALLFTTWATACWRCCPLLWVWGLVHSSIASPGGNRSSTKTPGTKSPRWATRHLSLTIPRMCIF